VSADITRHEISASLVNAGAYTAEALPGQLRKDNDLANCYHLMRLVPGAWHQCEQLGKDIRKFALGSKERRLPGSLYHIARMGNYLNDLGIDSGNSRDYEEHEKIHCTDVYHAHQHHRLWEEGVETYILALAHVHGYVSFPRPGMAQDGSRPSDTQTEVADNTVGPFQGPQPPIDMVVDAVLQCIYGMVMVVGVFLYTSFRRGL
jgi:hypothetical protein